MVTVSATGGSPDAPRPSGIDQLIAKLVSMARQPRRDLTKPFHFAVDHCFPIKGQGTVLTVQPPPLLPPPLSPSGMDHAVWSSVTPKEAVGAMRLGCSWMGKENGIGLA